MLPCILVRSWANRCPVFWSDAWPATAMYFGQANNKKCGPAECPIFWSDLLVGRLLKASQNPNLENVPLEKGELREDEIPVEDGLSRVEGYRE